MTAAAAAPATTAPETRPGSPIEMARATIPGASVTPTERFVMCAIAMSPWCRATPHAICRLTKLKRKKVFEVLLGLSNMGLVSLNVVTFPAGVSPCDGNGIRVYSLVRKPVPGGYEARTGDELAWQSTTGCTYAEGVAALAFAMEKHEED